MTPIIHDSRPITLVGGAAFAESALDAALAIGPGVVAADGGADAVLRRGLAPLAVIGDFDSISDGARAAIPAERQHHIPDQDSTDFGKCLALIDAPLILGVGFTGARPDHELAALNALVRHPEKRCVLIGEEMVTFLAPPRISLSLGAGSLLSLFPLGPVEGWSGGLEWPIRGIPFAADGRIGTSNRVTGPVTLGFDAPRMLVLVPRAALAEVCARLVSEPSGWSGG